MQPVLIALTVVLALGLFLVLQQLRDARQRLRSAAPRGPDPVDQRVESLRKELSAAREEISRKAKALEAARDEARKKSRREAKKARAEQDEASGAGGDEGRADARLEAERDRLQKAIAAVEQQMAQLQQDAEATQAAALAETKAGFEKERNDWKTQLGQREASAVELEREIRRLREELRRHTEDRADVPGTSLDLKALPADAVQELARLYRKGQEFERLHGIAQGKLQLSAERQQELQRRYYAVCRELALVAGGEGAKTASDEEVRTVAEAAVARSDAAASRRAPPPVAPRGAQTAPREPSQAEPATPPATKSALDKGLEDGVDDSLDDALEGPPLAAVETPASPTLPSEA